MSDYEDMIVPDLRKEIQQRLGVNERYTSRLNKTTLNSLYAYLTGEFYIYPDHIYAPFSDDKADIMKAIARQAELNSWIEQPTKTFNREQLVDILELMDERGDCREWAGERAELADD